MNHNTKFISYLKLVFERIYCPQCDSQMEKFSSPWILGWKCLSCRYITWYDIDKWGPLFDNFTKFEKKQKRNILRNYRSHILVASISFIIGFIIALLI